MPDKVNVKKMGLVYNKSYKPWHSEALADRLSLVLPIDRPIQLSRCVAFSLGVCPFLERPMTFRTRSGGAGLCTVRRIYAISLSVGVVWLLGIHGLDRWCGIFLLDNLMLAFSLSLYTFSGSLQALQQPCVVRFYQVLLHITVDNDSFRVQPQVQYRPHYCGEYGIPTNYVA